MLIVRDLSVRYGRTVALRGVTFSVPEGSIIALIGPNGAGKSTALLAIMGVVEATGEVELRGESILGQSTQSLVRRGMALVPEGRRIFGSLTVMENLVVGASVRKQEDDLEADLERELDRFPILRERARSPAGLLSGGEQQQLAFARALMGRPKLLLLDEPSLGLAPAVVDLVFDLLERLRQEGLTILLVEQNANRAIQLADYTHVLRTGEIVASGTDRELSIDRMASLYTGIHQP